MSLVRIKAARRTASHAEEIADLLYELRDQKPREIRTAEALEQFNEDKPK